MKSATERLLEEIKIERKELWVNTILTALAALGLVLGIFLPYFFAVPLYFIYGVYGLAYLAGGFPAAVSAVRTLILGKLYIDMLMVLAALAAALVGEVRDGAILLFLFSLAGALEGFAMGNTKRAVVALMRERPDEANLEKPNGELERVKVEQLEINQIVIVKPGERIPVDGLVLRGFSVVDQSPITGESVPVDKTVTDLVYAGAVNGYGVLAIKVTKLASESTLARMIELTASAQAERSPSERFSAWFGVRYTFVVLVGSVVALFVFILIDVPLTLALYKAATLLVVASPCAIVISVPAAVLSALASLARQGILFKGGAALEEFGLIDTVAFDKTGTLTTGRLVVKAVVPFVGTQSDLLQFASSIESHSEHPLASGIVTYAATLGIYPRASSDVTAIPGKGIKAVIAGVPVWAGNRSVLNLANVSLEHSEQKKLSDYEASGYTTIIICTENKVLGIIALSDSVRPNAVEAIATLRSLGVKRVVMLTGDNSRVANTIGVELGIKPEDIYADLLPEDKVAVVNKLRQDSKVAFVGDGVNDAAALVTAQVGIAMGVRGSDVALEAADVVMLSDDLRTVAVALRLARKTSRIIKQNLYFAIGILILMVLVTVFWYLPLPLGVIGHEGGTLLVVLNGLRLLL